MKVKFIYLDQSLILLDFPVVIESGLSISEVFKRELDIIFVSWLEVVQSIEGFVMPFLLGLFGSEYPLVFLLLFSNSKGVFGV